MALNAFTGVLTAQQIVRAADRRAGKQGLYFDDTGVETLTAPAYIELQSYLDHLAQAWDWPFNRIVLNIAITARAQTLPASFWRVAFPDALWMLDSHGGRHRVRVSSPEEWAAALTHDVTGIPERILFQPSNGSIYVDPIPDQSYFAELWYLPWQVPLATITTRPWFPWSEHLIAAVAVKLCTTGDDARVQNEAGIAQKTFKEIRHSISDQGQRGETIGLNPRIFRTPLTL